MILFYYFCVLGCVLASPSIRSKRQQPHDGQALVFNGKVTPPPSVPWHAGIYIPQGSLYVIQCGGTLIAPSVVVTAGHCFWDLANRRANSNLNTYKVTLGKTYREWELDTTSTAVQRLDIRRVVIHPRFRGYMPRRLEYDIALVELATPATITTSVKAVLIDWDNTLATDTDMGKVAGWGLTEGGEQSTKLRSLVLPYVNHEDCYESLAEDRFRTLLTSDKFCGGFVNKNMSLCPGDSGGGFVVKDKDTNQHFLRGLVSLDFRPSGFPLGQCYANHYTGFTDVSDPRYLTWMKKEFPRTFTQTATRPAPTAPGYELHPGLGYYKFHTSGKTWSRAKQTCELEGGHLLIINSVEEADVVKDLFKQAPALPRADNNDIAWVGVKEVGEGQYFTIFNQRLEESGYATWRSGQPDNSNPDDEIMVDRAGTLGDIPAGLGFKLAFFCEVKL